jgi:ferredoxin
MPLWTLIGLWEGKQTAPWPLAEGEDGQSGVLGMPRYRPDLCTEDCRACADVCPTEAITMQDGGGMQLKLVRPMR